MYMYKAAVMGDKDSISGFTAIGLHAYVCDENNAKEKLTHLVMQDYAIIYITEQLAEAIDDEIKKYKDRIIPAIILIPGITGNTGAGMTNISETVKKAVGADILS